METSETADLDCLLDLINEPDPSTVTSESDQIDIHTESNDNALDDLLGLINEDTVQEISASSPVQKQERTIKLNDFLFSTAPIQQDAPTTSQNSVSSIVHEGDTSSEDEEEKEYLTEMGQNIKEKIKPRSFYEDRYRKKTNSSWKSSPVSLNQSHSREPQSLDTMTGIRIINPLVAFDVMEKRLKDRKLVKMSFIKSHTKKGSDIEGDWVTIGVLVKKLPPKTSKTGNTFSVWKLTDLHSMDKIVSLFLFGSVHKELWKTAVGTVVGILNPIIMDPNEKEEYLSMKVDHPGKVMFIGTSKDFGHCKSKRKDGTQCTNTVNLSQCQYCEYHVKNEYHKLNAGSKLQSSRFGSGLTFKDKVLKGQNFFYAGQSFVPLGKPQKTQTKLNPISAKDKLTLSNLGLKRKAAVVLNEEKSKNVVKIAEMYGDAISKTAEKNSEFINNKLLVPSAGSRNILRHMIRSETPEGKSVCTTNPRELLNQHALQMRSAQIHKKDDITILKNLEPHLGKGLNPGQTLTFNIPSPQSSREHQLAKIRAIQKVKASGPIKRKNPNATKSNPEPKKIKAALENSFEENPDKPAFDKTVEKIDSSQGVARSRLGIIDLNSERVKKYLNKKSSHAYEVEMAEMEKEAAYFDRLEKKEAMEEKMSSTKEIVCDVVSCKQCRYTAHKAAERCKNESHPLKCHKAIKRFFSCKDCKQRTECFSRFPHRSCSNCGSSRYERTGMLKVRAGPKLDSEILNIKWDDAYFLNSLNSL